MVMQLKPFFVRLLPIVCLSLFTAFSLVASADAQSTLSTAIPYQGQLSDGGNPANGQYDFEFKLFDAASAGAQIGSTNSKEDVQVNSGNFAVELDFGGSAFAGAGRFLEIGVRAGNSTGAFTTLAPRRPLLAVPYALYSPSGSKPAYGMAANAPQDSVYAATNGLVGIGTTSPSQKLHVAGSFLRVDGRDNEATYLGGEFGDNVQVGSFNAAIRNVEMWNMATSNHMNLVAQNITAFGSVGMSGPDFVILPNGRGDGGRAIVHDVNDTLVINYGGDFSGAVRVDGSGLTVGGDFGVVGQLFMANDFVMAPNDRGDGGRAMVHLGNDTLVINYGGELTGGTSIESNLHVRGDTSVRSLQIRGGADIAEPFDMSDSSKIEPGMVVAIDPDHPGQLRLAQSAYDRMVAGVVSGAGGVNSGLIMQQEGTAAAGEHPVALTGRVYVWVDADKTPVNPGDLLTTSDTPGHAMKVTDHNKAQGAILGKAMGALAKGKGLVLMLVSLQ